MKNFLKRNYLHLICIGILIGFIVLGFVYFPNSICRVYEGGRDVVTSFGYYVCEMFEVGGEIKATVNDYPSLQIAESKFQPLTLIPENLDAFWAKIELYGKRLIDLINLIEYALFLTRVLLVLSQLLLPLMSLLLLLYCRISAMFRTQNNAYNVDSFGVKLVRYVYKRFLLPVFRFFKRLWAFAKEKKYVTISMYLWAFYFNIFTIILEVFAYYFYFCANFDVISLYRQVYKLLLDLTPMIRFIPVLVWIIIGLRVWNSMSNTRASSKQRHNENKNRGFGNIRQIFIYIIGLMGAGKTTQAVDMGLTYTVQMRDDAFEVLYENDMRFPMFPWINFENALKNAFEKHVVYDTRRCKIFVRQWRDKFLKEPSKENIFGYEFDTYAMTYYNRLSNMTIWDALEEYAQAYFIYTINVSLLISTFSVRTDSILRDIGNFPLWDHNFFNRDVRQSDLYSRYATIFDQDLVRLGKLMIDNNPHRYAFGFGIYIWDELDKERKNSLELNEVKANAKECNQKNDLMEPMIKVIRHGCMIGRRNFVRCIGTGQRADDLGAKLRGVCEVINIAKVGETDLLLPFWSPYYVFKDLFGWILNNHFNLYYQYRFNRSDNVLLLQCWHYLVSKYVQATEIIENRFGCQTVVLEVETDKLKGKFKKHKYYRQSDKVYKERFVSDASGDMFDRRRDYSEIGIIDMPTFSMKRATAEELDLTNSHFWNEHKKVG